MDNNDLKNEKVKETVPGNKVYSSIEKREQARNERRRERYEKDKDYRKKMRMQARESYMSKNNLSECKHVAVTDIHRLFEIGMMREIQSGPAIGNKYLTFNVVETAKALGNYNPQVVYRWIREGNIPQMLNRAFTMNGDSKVLPVTNVFTYDEMKHILRIMHQHQTKVSCYFSKKHVDVINRINKAVNKERGIFHD